MTFQQLKYGFVAVVGLTITGTTIYVIDNLRKQVEPVDVIEVVLATQERCLALSYSNTATWPDPAYREGILSFVRSWTSNSYSTATAVITTNIVTNAFGWWIDRDLMVTVDYMIQQIVPYYVDTNCFQNGTGAVVYLTVTGLFARLSIGDHTNKWTRSPCWTNAPVTNYVVTYTNFWPSTTTSGVVVCYTTDQRQAVNYASNYIAGQWKWTTQSNWPSFVTQTVNAATYGELGWQIYPEDMQERYKVLNALEWTVQDYHLEEIPDGYNDASFPYVEGQATIPAIKSACEAYYDSTNGMFADTHLPIVYAGLKGAPGLYNGWLGRRRSQHVVDGMTTSVTKRVSVFMDSYGLTPNAVTYASEYEYDDNGDGVVSGKFGEVEADVDISTNSSWTYAYSHTNKPSWPDGPAADEDLKLRGYQVSNAFVVLKWNFQYATNKYW
jgi:hypothetical protein